MLGLFVLVGLKVSWDCLSSIRVESRTLDCLITLSHTISKVLPGVLLGKSNSSFVSLVSNID